MNEHTHEHRTFHSLPKMRINHVGVCVCVNARQRYIHADDTICSYCEHWNICMRVPQTATYNRAWILMFVPHFSGNSSPRSIQLFCFSMFCSPFSFEQPTRSSDMNCDLNEILFVYASTKLMPVFVVMPIISRVTSHVCHSVSSRKNKMFSGKPLSVVLLNCPFCLCSFGCNLSTYSAISVRLSMSHNVINSNSSKKATYFWLLSIVGT